MTPETLREWRGERGMTQAQLAAAVGVSARQVRRWETGENKIPKLLEIYTAEFQWHWHESRAHINQGMNYTLCGVMPKRIAERHTPSFSGRVCPECASLYAITQITQSS